MGNVVEFPGRQHAEGEAVCMRCGYLWFAKARVGAEWFECPNCHTMKGLFRFTYQLPAGSLVRECGCGNQLFYLTPEGHLCPNCGTYQRY